ncbi:AI-2E family transporter [archaeon]|nr:AI-2E family transporter [archaeon]
MEISKKNYLRYSFIGLFLLVLILSFLVVRDFLIPLITGIVLVYFFYPVYKKIKDLVKNKNVASLITIILIILIVTIPLFFIIKSLIVDSLAFYQNLETWQANLSPAILEILKSSLGSLSQSISSFVFSLPSFAISILITFYLMFYLFRDGEQFLKSFKKNLPLKKKHKDKLFNEFKTVSNAVAYGLILTGVIEGIIGGIGFWIFGIPNPIFWGLIMAILTILPAVGTSIVWIPAGIIALLQGDYFSGIGILIYGALIITSIELILKPKLIGDRTKLHPLLIILGVLGGLQFFGFIGIVLGPFILVTLTTLLKMLVIKNET